MVREVAGHKVCCEARTHFLIVDDRFIRWRCTDGRCPDVQEAKRRGRKAYHVLDWETRRMWTDFEPGDRQEQE